MKSYLAMSLGQTPDGVWHQAGSRFETDAPEGDWMQPIDKDGKPIAKKAKATKVKPTAEQSDAIKAEKDRADAAEKLLDETSKRADAAEQERDKALAELAELKAKK